MASRNPHGAGPKLSFASVAAMAPLVTPNQLSAGNDNKNLKSSKSPSETITKGITTHSPTTLPLDRELPMVVPRLDVRESPIGTIPEQEIIGALRSGLRLDDEKTHLSYSSTKAASLDGKSVASGTTFAMDEKESLRPDDSASVKAGEEDESYSGPASGAPSSRVGSEAGGKAFRDQFNEISERMGPGSSRGLPPSRQVIPGIAEEGPQGTVTNPLPVIPAPTSMPRQELPPVVGTGFTYDYQQPDEKLIEALETPKDRLFLLQLEQQVISFIKDSQEPILDLPPCNSFCRLLAHRLGDYYALTHFVDNAVSAVRLYRTPYCRLPTPLGTFSKPSGNSDGPLSTHPSVKIMRRAELGIDGQNGGSGANTNASSMAASKAGSEAGDDSQRGTGMVSPTDSANAKDKSAMTREEREAKYKETRDRIFKGFEDTENPEVVTGNETPNEVSRTSSTTGKKKKKPKHTDDGFEARSQFNAYYPQIQYSGPTYDPAANSSTFFNPYMPQHNNQSMHTGMPQSYSQPFQPAQHPQGYQMQTHHTSMINGNGLYAQHNTGPSLMPYIQQMPSQCYQPLQQNQMAEPSSAISSPALSNSTHLSRPQSQMSDQNWSPSNYSSQYQMFGGPQPAYQQQNQSMMQGNTSTTSMPFMTYPFGQLPFQPAMQGGRSQHPLPGSYNRQFFNPQTQAFVPSNGFGPQATGFVHRSGYPQGNAPRANPQAGNGVLFGQQQNTHAQTPQTPQPGQFITPYISPSYTARKSTGQTPRSQSPGQSTLSKWGTPATLPPKPPPPEAPSTSSITTIQNMTSAQGMPTFQNGTYSAPGNTI